MGRFDKPWEDPNNPIITARPSATHAGGTVYYYADGSRILVYGGKGAAYRANSPGLNVAPRATNNHGQYTESEPHYRARVEDEFKHYQQYGAVGYTESSGGTGQIVFSNAAAAKSAYEKILDDKYKALSSDGQPHSVLKVLHAYNAKGNPCFDKTATDAFSAVGDGFGNHADLLQKEYGELTPDEKAMVINKGLRSEGYDNPRGQVQIKRLDPKPPPPSPWQKVSMLPDSDESAVQPTSAGSETGPPWARPSLRAALEQRAADLGVGYGEYMPTDALLAEIHGREAAAAGPEEADGLADRIEQEIDGIGLPLVAQPELGNPPPLGLGAPTRAELDRRAAGLGLRFGPAVPDDTVLAAVHSQESDAAPPAAADALADRMEREIDGTLSAANIPWNGGGDAMDMGEGQA
jgi:hypothetical protein